MNVPLPCLYIGIVALAVLLLVAAVWLYLCRRATLRELRDARRRERMLFRSMPGCTYMVDAETRTIEDINESAANILGYARDDLIGQPCRHICSHSTQCCLHPETTTSLEQMESTIRSRDGEVIPILKSARVITIDGREKILENFLEITRIRNAEEAQRESEQRERKFRRQLTILHEVIVELTGESTRDALSRRVVELMRNRLGFERVALWFADEDREVCIGSFGTDEHGNLRDERDCVMEFLADPAVRWALAENGPRTLVRRGALLNNHAEIIGEGWHAVATLWNGERVTGYIACDTLLSGEPILEPQQRVLSMLATSVGHLCTRLAAESERSRLVEAMEQSAEAVVITNAEGKIEYGNQGVSSVLGYSAEELRGQSADALYHADNSPDLLAEKDRTIREGRAWSSEMLAGTKQSDPLDVIVTISPIRNSDGQMEGYIHTLRDISREVHLEEQLRHADKMQAIGRLAGGIAHDFNNQLTVVKGYCDLLLRELQEADPLHEPINQIDRACRQASMLTSELLSFSRRQILRPQVVCPNTIIRDMRNALSLVGESIQLELTLRDDCGNIEIDPGRLEQALMNLAINARDAMPRGGHLCIETGNFDLSREYLPAGSDLPAGPYVMIVVRDTGLGMDRQTREQIFEPFFTTKARGEGTGLGLAMVYGFVRQSGGTIDVTSELGQGTTFRIYLPCAGKTALTAPAPVDSHPELQSGSADILLVEDDDSVRNLVVRILHGRGYRVQATGDPAEARDLLQQAQGPMDLLITDVVMPNQSGPDMANALLEIQPNLRVLYMSGYTEEAILQQGLGDQAVEFLHKPFSAQDLCQTVARILSDQATHV